MKIIDDMVGSDQVEALKQSLNQILPTAWSMPSELVQALKKDHDDLREFIEVLKSDKAIATRRTAFRKLVTLLESHSQAEEKAVYAASQKYPELRKKTLEGFVEHDVASLVAKRAKGIRDPEKWSANAQVLAELVEHHLDEEERDLFPVLDKVFSVSTKLEAERKFLELRLISSDQTHSKLGVVSLLN